MTFADAKQRFSNRVTDYVRYRPSYPSALLDLLRAECDLRPDRTIADIGSGTGLLTKLFLDNGNRVFGVEPNEEMRAASEHFLEGNRNFSSINGSAEATALPPQSQACGLGCGRLAGPPHGRYPVRQSLRGAARTLRCGLQTRQRRLPREGKDSHFF